MKIQREKKTSSLRKKMIFYFLLIAIANILVAVEFLWEIKSSSYRTEIASLVTLIKNGVQPITHAFTILDDLSSKFIIMIAILIIVSAVVLFMFVWQVASPIQYMINQAKKMADGDLSTTITIRSDDEIAVLGRLINDLSINLQEVIAQVDSMVTDFKDDLATFDESLSERPLKLSTIKTNLAMVESNIMKLEMLKNAFTLYTIDHSNENKEN